MAFATATTLGLISLIGGAASNIFGAKKQADAAKEASGQQVASAEQAKAELRPLYEQSVARMDPYAQLGGQAVGQLRALGGYPALPPQAAPMAAQAAPSMSLGAMGAPQSPPAPGMKPGGDPARAMALLGHPAQQSQSSYGNNARLSGPQGPTGGSSFGLPQQGAPSLVRLQAPDGEQREVPADLAERMIAAGARRV